jgi:drug/metabolite transporter (DMT)-like permease
MLFCTMIWGGTFPIIKTILKSSDSLSFIISRFSLALIIYLLIQWNRFHLWNTKIFLSSFFVGVSLFLGFILQFKGLEYTSAIKSGFITGCFIFFVPFFEWSILKRKISYKVYICLGIILVGLSVMSGILSSGIEDLNVGDLFTLLSAFFFAIYLVLMEQFPQKTGIHWREFAFFQIFWVWIFSFLFHIYLFFTTGHNIELGFENFQKLEFILGLSYTGILATILTVSLQSQFQKNISPTQVSFIFSLEPVFSAIFSFLWIGEKMKIDELVGAGLILLGVITYNLMTSPIESKELN